MNQIYVRLLGEAVDVRRPVQAKHLGGFVYKIAEQAYDTDLETWEYEPGEHVVCEYVESSDGGRILLAARRAEDKDSRQKP